MRQQSPGPRAKSLPTSPSGSRSGHTFHVPWPPRSRFVDDPPPRLSRRSPARRLPCRGQPAPGVDHASNPPPVPILLPLFLLPDLGFAQDKVVDDAHLITRQSVGRVGLGSSVSDALTALGRAAPDGLTEYEGLLVIEISDGDALLLRLVTDQAIDGQEPPSLDPGASIYGIIVESERYRTEAGIGIGYSIREAAQSYGRARLYKSPLHGSERVSFGDLPEAFRFSCAASDGDAGIYHGSRGPYGPQTTDFKDDGQLISVSIWGSESRSHP